ncbi:MAG TPA: hypothetical protein VGE21_08180 [Flavobacteriales bacterium]
MDPDAVNDHWSASDTERFGALYPEVLYAEYDSVGDPRYAPTLLAILPSGREEGRILRVTWTDRRTDPAKTSPRCTFDFVAERTEEGMRLSRPLAVHTRTWERRTVGTITYIISPEHRFSEEQALEQQEVIGKLSRFFGVAPFPITYYSFSGPADLYRARGFIHHPLMWTIPSGGLVDERGNVYSGNDKDIYTHEVVHLFSHRRTKEPPPLLEEGLATLLGGSVEHDYAWHRANLQRYLASDPGIDLRSRCNTYVTDYIAEETSVPYVIGAVLCERILRTGGKEELLAVMAAGPDPWPALARHGITPENLTTEVRKELAFPPLRTPW